MRTIYIITFISFFVSVLPLKAQVTIGSGKAPTKGAIIEIKTKDADQDNLTSDNGGMVLPRIKLESLNILSPIDGGAAPQDRKGMIVYNVTTDVSQNLYPGIYEWTGSKWISVANTDELKQPWNAVKTKAPATDKNMDSYIMGNTVIGDKEVAIISTKNDFAKLTVSNGEVYLNGITLGQGSLNSTESVALGANALSNTVSGAKSNTAIGSMAMGATTTGSNNIAIGANALNKNTTGTDNIAIGTNAASNLTTGSNNIYIGYNNTTSTENATANGQINIGNLIYGVQGSSLASLGQIGIATSTPKANLHVAGNMRINPDQIPNIRGFAPLVISNSGRIGSTMLLPIFTLNTVLQSTMQRRFEGGASGNAGATQMSNDFKTLDERRPLYLSFISQSSDIVSNTLISIESQTNMPQYGTVKIEEDVLAEISGYIFYQGSYLMYPNDINNDPFFNYTTSNKNSASISLFLEYTPANSSQSEILTSGNQIWYGANAANTIKIIQLQPIIKQLKKGDTLKWYITRSTNSIRLNQMSTGNNITRPSGGKYSQGLFILGLSK